MVTKGKVSNTLYILEFEGVFFIAYTCS